MPKQVSIILYNLHFSFSPHLQGLFGKLATKIWGEKRQKKEKQTTGQQQL